MLTWCGPAWNFNIRAHPAFLEHPCQPFPHPWASIPSISAPGWLFLGFLEFSLERGSGRGTGMGWEQGEVQHAQIHIPREKQPRGAGIPPPPGVFQVLPTLWGCSRPSLGTLCFPPSQFPLGIHGDQGSTGMGGDPSFPGAGGSRTPQFPPQALPSLQHPQKSPREQLRSRRGTSVGQGIS